MVDLSLLVFKYSGNVVPQFLHIIKLIRWAIVHLCFLSSDNEGQIPPSAESRDIFGILGIINLLAGM